VECFIEADISGNIGTTKLKRKGCATEAVSEVEKSKPCPVIPGRPIRRLHGGGAYHDMRIRLAGELDRYVYVYTGRLSSTKKAAKNNIRLTSSLRSMASSKRSKTRYALTLSLVIDALERKLA